MSEKESEIYDEGRCETKENRKAYIKCCEHYNVGISK